MVVVGLPWYKIIRRTLELRVFSAGRYSMGMGLPDLESLREIGFRQRVALPCSDES
jgi:hypothetical protein